MIPITATAIACLGVLLAAPAAHAAEGPVRDFYCDGLPAGPCALPEAETKGKVPPMVSGLSGLETALYTNDASTSG